MADMVIENINWKLYLDNPEAANPEEFFRVFNGWIPESPEIYIDVADYQHVHDGPLVLLSGHYVNYVLDTTDGRPGLLYDRRQPLDPDLDAATRLVQSLQEIFVAAKRLEGEEGFSKKPRFATGELRLILNNRALTPNTPEAYAALKPHLEKALGQVFGEGGFKLEYVQGDKRQRLSVTVRAANAKPLEALASSAA